MVGTHVRYDAFLRNIPPERRIGDYAHGASRILNAVLKRLDTVAPTWGPRARITLRQEHSGGCSTHPHQRPINALLEVASMDWERPGTPFLTSWWCFVGAT